MPDPNPSPAPQVQDQRQKPPGILPRHAQNWLIAGLALLMVSVIALSGKNPPKESRGSAPSQATTIVDPSAARIQEYRRLVDEQTRKLQLEQAGLTPGPAPSAPVAATPYGSNPGPYQRP